MLCFLAGLLTCSAASVSIGVEVLVLAAGAIACAFSPKIRWLIGFRFILGIGIGGALTRIRIQSPSGTVFYRLVDDRKLLSRLAVASADWFLMDFAYYGNAVSSPLVLSALRSDHTILQKTLTQLGIFVVFAAPGYAGAALTMDTLGRNVIQNLGFIMMAVTFGLLALIPDIERLVYSFLLIYGFSYFFTEFGPNANHFYLSIRDRSGEGPDYRPRHRRCLGQDRKVCRCYYLSVFHAVERFACGRGRSRHRQYFGPRGYNLLASRD
jgi:hypothetical protein